MHVAAAAVCLLVGCYFGGAKRQRVYDNVLDIACVPVFESGRIFRRRYELVLHRLRLERLNAFLA